MMPPFYHHFSLCLVREVTSSHAFSRAKACLVSVLLPACLSLTPSLKPGRVALGPLPCLWSLPGHLTPSAPNAKQRPCLPIWEANVTKYFIWRA